MLILVTCTVGKKKCSSIYWTCKKECLNVKLVPNYLINSITQIVARKRDCYSFCLRLINGHRVTFIDQ